MASHRRTDISFKDRDVARAAKRAEGRDLEVRPVVDQATLEATLNRVEGFATNENDPATLRILRDEVRPLAADRSLSQQLRDRAGAILRSIEVKLAYQAYNNDDQAEEEEVIVRVAKPAKEAIPPKERPRKIVDIEERLVKMSDRIGQTIDSLATNNTLWNMSYQADSDQAEDVMQERRRMIFSAVVKDHDYTEGEIALELSDKGKKGFFKRIDDLRALSQQYNQILLEKEQASAPVVAEVVVKNESVNLPVRGSETPVSAARTTSARRQRAEQKLANAQSGPSAEPIALSDRQMNVEKSPELSTALVLLRETREAAEQRDAERREQRYREADAIAAEVLAEPALESTSSEPEIVTSPVPERQRTHADELVEKYEIPNATPEAVGQWTNLLTEVEALMDPEVADVHEMVLARTKLDEARDILGAEQKRIIAAFRAKRMPKQEKERLESYVRDGRRRRDALLRRVREAIKQGLGDPANVEAAPEVTTMIQGELDRVRADIRVAMGLLEDRPLHADVVNDLIGATETRLSTILKDIEDFREAGGSVAALEANAVIHRDDLRKLQARAKEVIGNLSQSEVSATALEIYQPQAVELAVETKQEVEPQRARRRKSETHIVTPVTIPGTGFDGFDGINPSAEAPTLEGEAPAPAGVFTRARESWGRAMNYIRNGWKTVEDSRLYREEILGELAPHELDKSIEVSRTEKALQIAAGLGGGLASVFGAAIVPDVIRWGTQSRAAQFDRDDFKQSISEAIRTRQELYGNPLARTEATEARFQGMLARHQERQQTLLEKINRSRRLKPEHKAALIAKLTPVLQRFEEGESALRVTEQGEIEEEINETLDRVREEAEAVLDTHVVSKVSGHKVLKEGANTALALSGMHFARGPVYAAHSIMERYAQARRDRARGERKSEVTVANVIKEGFVEWWSKGKSGTIRERRQALGTLVRYAGFGLMATGGANAIELDQVLDRASDSVRGYAAELYDKWFGEEVVVAPETPVASPVVDGPEYATPPVEAVPDFRGEIPAGSRVVGGSEREGITYVLSRVIKLNPEAYGFDGGSDVGADLFAKRMAVKITEGDGQMRRWLTDKAIDKLNLFPEFKNGEWHIAAVVDGKKLSMAELAERGYTSNAPASSK